ncbi:MAG: putative transposase [Solirubrobacteraceae bacterium]
MSTATPGLFAEPSQARPGRSPTSPGTARPNVVKGQTRRRLSKEARRKRNALITASVIRGTTTRAFVLDTETYEVAKDGWSRSRISDAFVAASREQLHDMNSRPLGPLNLAVVVVDGIRAGGYTELWAIGITTDGTKVPLRLVEHPVEDAEAMSRLVRALVDGGADLSNAVFVMDGASWLEKGLRDALGLDADVERLEPTLAIQNCVMHLGNNVKEHVENKLEYDGVRVRMANAMKKTNRVERKRLLNRTARELEAMGQSEAALALRQHIPQLTATKAQARDAGLPYSADPGSRGFRRIRAELRGLVPETAWDGVGVVLHKGWRDHDYHRALRRFGDVEESFRGKAVRADAAGRHKEAKGYISAANSIRDGAQKTLTLSRIGVTDAGLRRSISSSNIIESVHKEVRGVLRRHHAKWSVDDDPHQDKRQRWVAASITYYSKAWSKVASPAALVDLQLLVLKARHRHVEMRLADSSRQAVELLMIKVPAELQGQGKADAAMRDLLRWADRNGKTLAVTPRRVGPGADDAALEAWWRRHGFVSNIGRDRNLSVSATMLREPQPIGPEHGSPDRGTRSSGPQADEAAEGRRGSPVRGAEDRHVPDRPPSKRVRGPAERPGPRSTRRDVPTAARDGPAGDEASRSRPPDPIERYLQKLRPRSTSSVNSQSIALGAFVAGKPNQWLKDRLLEIEADLRRAPPLRGVVDEWFTKHAEHAARALAVEYVRAEDAVAGAASPVAHGSDGTRLPTAAPTDRYGALLGAANVRWIEERADDLKGFVSEHRDERLEASVGRPFELLEAKVRAWVAANRQLISREVAVKREIASRQELAVIASQPVSPEEVIDAAESAQEGVRGYSRLKQLRQSVGDRDLELIAEQAAAVVEQYKDVDFVVLQRWRESLGDPTRTLDAAKASEIQSLRRDHQIAVRAVAEERRAAGAATREARALKDRSQRAARREFLERATVHSATAERARTRASELRERREQLYDDLHGPAAWSCREADAVARLVAVEQILTERSREIALAGGEIARGGVLADSRTPVDGEKTKTADRRRGAPQIEQPLVTPEAQRALAANAQAARARAPTAREPAGAER